MVKLTTKYLFRKISKKNQVQPRKKDESDLDYLNRITHLYLQSQFIDKIASVPQCQSVSVVYLQNNLLQNIQNLDNFPKLTHLYLQHNYISKIENLSKLTALKKLYLGWNEISVVEGLEGLRNLTELHLENQRLPQGETLYFDPRTICRLGRSLKVLNITNNNVTSILCLEGLKCLTKLVADENQIRDLEDVEETLFYLPCLEELSMIGNPVTGNRKYFDTVMVASKSLKILNGKSIDPQTKIFAANLTANRELRRKLSEFSMRALDSEGSLPDSQGDANYCGGATPHIGSKLFPLVKNIDTNCELLVRLPSKMSDKNVSPVFQNSLKVVQLPNSNSFNY